VGPRILRTAAGQRETAPHRDPCAAFKWIRILFRCWKERKPYDEAIYQRALDARRPKKQLAAQTVELQWKNVAGVLKIATKEA
jgi:hypothetical protein